MSSYNILSQSSSSSDSSFDVVDRFNARRVKLNDRYLKYENRLSKLINKIKVERRKFVPPPPIVPTVPQDIELRSFHPAFRDERSYATVASSSCTGSFEEIPLNYPIVKSNINKINILQREINITKWRLEKCHNQLIRLNKLEVFKAFNVPVTNVTAPIVEINNSPYVDSEVVINIPINVVNKCQKFRKFRKSKSSIHCDIYGLYIPRPVAQRNPFLALKLRNLIKSFRTKIKYSSISFPQMDAHGDSTNTLVDKEYNTVLATQRDVSEGISSQTSTWENFCSSDKMLNFNEVLSRWSKYSTFTWDAVGTSDKSFNVFTDILSELKNTPLNLPYRNYRYWKGDLELKFIINSNKFQVGSLQISYLYGIDYEYQTDLNRNNIFSLSQTNHCLLNAGSSNEGLLVIPFKYFNPLITTNYKSYSQNIARVYINVLNTLQTVSNNYNVVEVTIFARITNSLFSGTVPMRIAQPQMFHLIRSLIKTTEFGLNQIEADNNRDSPVDPSQPSHVFQHSSSSFCVGKNLLNPSRPLRLDALAQTPHPVQTNDMLIKRITRSFGLLSQILWSRSDDTGKQLMCIEASPIGPLNSYYSRTEIVQNRSIKLLSVPPVGVISSLFSYWRGTLELRFDIVASSLHTGSLMIAFVPSDKTVTMDDCRSCNYAICNIQEQQSFTFTIPYIADSVLWPRKNNPSLNNTSDKIHPPGYVYIFVLNRLIPNDQIPGQVTINTYLRGGIDFEVSVPCQPCFSTPYNLQFRDNRFNQLVPISNVGNNIISLFLGNAQFSDSQSTMICRATNINPVGPLNYQNYRDGSPENEIINPGIWRIIDYQAGKFAYYLRLPGEIIIKDVKDVDTKISYAFLYNECGSPFTCYTEIFFSTKENAISYVKSDQNWNNVLQYAFKCSLTQPGFPTVINFGYFEKVYPPALFNDFEIIDPQNEERTLNSENLSPTQILASSETSMSYFGERFDDLKDYCRRYQYYTSFSLPPTNKDYRKRVGCIIPILPQGLNNSTSNTDGTINHIVNRSREGFIPLIASGYRFYRGSLRIKIVVQIQSTGNIWVQHRPDALLTSLKISFPNSETDSLSDFFNHSYSTVIQSLANNNIIEIEIPWYKRNLYNFSFLPNYSLSDSTNRDALNSYSLGNLVIGFDNIEITKPISVELYIAVADDFRFHTFQGFPLLLPITHIPNVGDPQMGFLSTLRRTTQVVHDTENLVDRSTTLVNDVDRILKQIPDLVSNTFKDIGTNITTIIIDVFSQLVHGIINPTITTFAIAIAVILIKLGIVTFNMLTELKNIITKIFSYFCESDEVLPQSDCEMAELCGGLGSILWSGLCAFFSCNFKTCNNLPSYCKELTVGLTKGMTSGNIVFRFLKNNFVFIDKCYSYIVRKTYRSYHRYLTISDEKEDLIQWLDMSYKLLDPSNLRKIQNNPYWRETLYSAARYGHVYLCDRVEGKVPFVDQYIRKIHNELISLRDSMVEEKLFPSLRQEAYGLWIDGDSGIGKSSMVTRLVHDILKSVNYKGNDDLVFNLNPTDKYWTNCKKQPCCLIDDAFQVTSPEAVAMQLWAYFQIMSPVPLIPPMAELHEKKNHYDPELFVTCSNNPFPKLPSLQSHDALYRRRHQLIKARLRKPECKKYPYGYTEEEVMNIEHLIFNIAFDVRNEQTHYRSDMTYKELIIYLSHDFLEFKRISNKSYEERKKLQFAFWTDDHSFDNNPFATINQKIDNFNENRKRRFNNIPTSFGSINNINEENSFITKCIDKLVCVKNQTLELFTEKITEPQMNIYECTMPPEEEKKMDEEIKQMSKDSNQEPIIKIDSLEKLETEYINMGEHLDFSPEIVIKYFSQFVNLCISRTNKEFNNVDCKDQRLWIDLNNAYNDNKLPNDPFINKVHNRIPKKCVHQFVNKDSLLVIKNIDGYNVPLWKVKVDLILDSFVNGDCFSSNNLFVSDCPCAYNCILLNDAKEWVRIVSEWLGYQRYYNFNIDSNHVAPIVKKIIYTQSSLKKYFAYVTRMVVKISKVGIFDILFNGFHWLGRFIKQFGFFITGFAALFGFAGYLLMPSPQLISSGDTTTKNAPSNVRQIVFSNFISSAQAQLGETETIDNVILKRILNNTVYIVYEDNERNIKSNMKCLVLRERYVLILKHYYEYIKYHSNSSSKISLMWETGIIDFNIDDYTIDWCKDSNFGIFKLGNEFAPKKNIIKFIAPKNQHKSVLRESSIIDIQLNKAVLYEQNISLHELLTISPTSYSEPLVIPFAYKYNKNYPGMCGSILINNNNQQQPIIGIHVAGANGKGYSEPICFEQLSEYFLPKRDEPIDWRKLECKEFPINESKLYLNGTHTYLGTVDQFFSKSESGVSQIIPSTIHTVFPVVTTPGPLSPKDPRINNKFSPLVEGCEKHCNITKNFNSEHLDIAFNHLNNKIISNCKPARLTVNKLSEIDAVNGLDIDHYERIVLNTSEGFPLSRFRPKGYTDKKWLFSLDNNNKVAAIHPRLREILDSKHNDRLNCVIPLTVHDDCLKDARLPINKALIPGKVRVFSISPVDFTIQFRQYFLDFIASYTNARFNAEHAIGINIHGREWSELANKFVGSKVITGDYSGFGPTLNSRVVNKAFDIIINWYISNGCDKDDTHIRKMMKYELINSIHLMGNYLYQVSCGLPSGNPATVIFNSLVNSLYIRCAWLDIMAKTKYLSLVDFDQLCYLITYGDDLLMRVSEKVYSMFNNNSLSLFFHKHDIKFTDAAKTGINVEPYVDFIDSTFLKHSFVVHPYRKNMYLAKLDINSVTDCVNWIRKNKDISPKQATKEACLQGAMLAYGHGERYYIEYCLKLNQAWQSKYNELIDFRTWKQLDSLFIDHDFYFDI